LDDDLPAQSAALESDHHGGHGNPQSTAEICHPAELRVSFTVGFPNSEVTFTVADDPDIVAAPAVNLSG
jgi:hypothetical protein